MRLVDLYCPKCLHEERDALVGATRPACPHCGVQLEIVCNGGVGARARYLDQPPPHDRYWEGQVEAQVEHCGVSTDGDFKPGHDVTRLDGSPVPNLDRIAERHERLRHERRARCGQNPIYLTRRASRG